jgi:hypothetical protein
MKARRWGESMGRDQMVIDRQLPECDVVLAVHKIVDAVSRRRSPQTAPPLAKLTLADAAGLPRWLALPDRVSKAALVGCVGPGNIAGMAPAVARSRQMCLHRPRRAWITWWGVRLAARRFPGRLIDQEIGGEQMRGMLRLRRAQLETDAAETAARLARVEARLRSIEREGAMPPDDVILTPLPRSVWLS